MRRESLAETGYVLARDAWGRGFATEALEQMVTLGTTLGLRSITAHVHLQNTASIRVLEKAGFTRSPASVEHTFPNLSLTGAVPALEYTLSLA